MGESSTSDPSHLPTRRVQKPKRLEKIMLQLPTKDLMKETASLCAQVKLSQRPTNFSYTKITLSGGGDVKDFVTRK